MYSPSSVCPVYLSLWVFLPSSLYDQSTKKKKYAYIYICIHIYMRFVVIVAEISLAPPYPLSAPLHSPQRSRSLNVCNPYTYQRVLRPRWHEHTRTHTHIHVCTCMQWKHRRIAKNQLVWVEGRGLLYWCCCCCSLTISFYTRFAIFPRQRGIALLSPASL